MYFVKSGPYKIKCYYHIYKEASSPTIFNLNSASQQSNRGISNTGSFVPPLKKGDKFSKEEISFKIQIYKVRKKFGDQFLNNERFLIQRIML